MSEVTSTMDLDSFETENNAKLIVDNASVQSAKLQAGCVANSALLNGVHEDAATGEQDDAVGTVSNTLHVNGVHEDAATGEQDDAIGTVSNTLHVNGVFEDTTAAGANDALDTETRDNDTTNTISNHVYINGVQEDTNEAETDALDKEGNVDDTNESDHEDSNPRDVSTEPASSSILINGIHEDGVAVEVDTTDTIDDVNAVSEDGEQILSMVAHKITACTELSTPSASLLSHQVNSSSPQTSMSQPASMVSHLVLSNDNKEEINEEVIEESTMNADYQVSDNNLESITETKNVQLALEIPIEAGQVIENKSTETPEEGEFPTTILETKEDDEANKHSTDDKDFEQNDPDGKLYEIKEDDEANKHSTDDKDVEPNDPDDELYEPIDLAKANKENLISELKSQSEEKIIATEAVSKNDNDRTDNQIEDQSKVTEINGDNCPTPEVTKQSTIEDDSKTKPEEESTNTPNESSREQSEEPSDYEGLQPIVAFCTLADNQPIVISASAETHHNEAVTPGSNAESETDQPAEEIGVESKLMIAVDATNNITNIRSSSNSTSITVVEQSVTTLEQQEQICTSTITKSSSDTNSTSHQFTPETEQVSLEYSESKFVTSVDISSQTTMSTDNDNSTITDNAIINSTDTATIENTDTTNSTITDTAPITDTPPITDTAPVTDTKKEPTKMEEVSEGTELKSDQQHVSKMADTKDVQPKLTEPQDSFDKSSAVSETTPSVETAKPDDTMTGTADQPATTNTVEKIDAAVVQEKPAKPEIKKNIFSLLFSCFKCSANKEKEKRKQTA